MNKYIDAEKLKAEIENQQRRLCVLSSNNETELRKDAATQNAAYSHILSIVDSLQQEQQEVDLEKEVKKYFQGYWPGMETAEQCNTDMHFTPPAIMRIAEYFYKLGLNARKEESK